MHDAYAQSGGVLAPMRSNCQWDENRLAKRLEMSSGSHYGIAVGLGDAVVVMLLSLSLMLSTREMLSEYRRWYQSSKAIVR